jgi:uncharacterized protein
MDAPTQRVLDRLRAHEAELRALGVRRLALFGSVARGEATPGSDVDLVVRLGPEFSTGGFDHFGRLDALRRRLAAIVGRDVDLIEEPVRKARLRREIEAARVHAF